VLIPNLAQRRVTVSRPNAIWVNRHHLHSDVAGLAVSGRRHGSVPTKNVGWAAEPTLHRELVLNAVLVAVRSRRSRGTIQILRNRELAKADVADYIETFYNRTRRHSHLGGLSTEQFEAAHKARRRGLH